jgi:hypothetical protein
LHISVDLHISVRLDRAGNREKQFEISADHRAIPRHALRMRSCFSGRFPYAMMRRAARSEKSRVSEQLVSSAD